MHGKIDSSGMFALNDWNLSTFLRDIEAGEALALHGMTTTLNQIHVSPEVQNGILMTAQPLG